MWIGSPSVWAGISPSTACVAGGVDEAAITLGFVVCPKVIKEAMSRIAGNTLKEVRNLFMDYPIKNLVARCVRKLNTNEVGKIQFG
jgi:hypothetical protein